MNHYKLREGESIRKPVVKRDRIEIHVPVLLLCIALAALIWLYVVGLSKINRETLSEADSTPVTEKETASASLGESLAYLLPEETGVDPAGSSVERLF